MDNIDLTKFCIRTDLAFEAIDINELTKEQGVIDEEYEYKKMVLKRTIINHDIADRISKKAGIYYCLDTSAIKTHDHDDIVDCEDVLTDVIKDIMKIEGITQHDKGLVVGLGNINVTPDSLGPLVIDNVIVTRHMFLLHPDEVSEGISNVSAISPGVMGNTGIETFDIIEAIIKKIQVDYVIVVDALASKSISRVNKTIQVTNTGIAPGSGVGNRRKELSKETIGIPVIAIGVPTVVDAVTIASDTVEFLLKYFNTKLNPEPKDSLIVNKQIDFDDASLPDKEYTKHFMGEFGALDDDAKRELIREVLTPNGYNMMVTPKEVDIDIADLTAIISRSIDRALHPLANHKD